MRHLKINQFGGGQNTRLSSDRLDVGEGTLVHNVDVDSGALRSMMRDQLDSPRAATPRAWLHMEGGQKVFYDNRGDNARCSGRTFRLERGGATERLQLLDDDFQPSRIAGMQWVDTPSVVASVEQSTSRVAKVEVSQSGLADPISTGAYHAYVTTVTLSHEDESVLRQVFVGMRIRALLDDPWSASGIYSSSVITGPLRVLAVGDVQQKTDVAVRTVPDGGAFDPAVSGYEVRTVGYTVDVLCGGQLSLYTLYGVQEFDEADVIMTRNNFGPLFARADGRQTLYAGAVVIVGDDGSETDVGLGLGPTASKTITFNGIAGQTQVQNAQTSFMTCPEYASGFITQIRDDVVGFTVGDSYRGLFPLLEFIGVSREIYQETWGRLVVVEDQPTSFLSVLEEGGKYTYCVTVSTNDGRESAPFAPGESEGVVLEVEDFESSIVLNSDPSWWPAPLTRRRVTASVSVNVPAIRGSLQAFGLGPSAIASCRLNLYRTLKDGADYYLIEDVAFPFTSSDNKVFTDETTDFTLFQQPSLQSLDHYPPHLRANDEGAYSFTYEDRYLMPGEGVLFLVGGDRVSFSKLNQPDAWGLNDWIELPSEAVAATVHGPFLVVFCEDGSIWRVAGNSAATIAQDRLETKQINLSHDCTREMGGRVVFPSPDGICLFDGVTAVPVTRPKLNGLTLDSAVEPHAVVKDGVYYLWTGTTDFNYRMEILANGVRLDTFWSPASYSAVDEVRNVILVNNNDAPSVGIEGGVSQFSERIMGGSQEFLTGTWWSRVFRIGESHYPVHFSQFWIDASGSGTVEVLVDGKPVIQKSFDTVGREVVPWRFPAGTRGRLVQLRLTIQGVFNEAVASYKQLRTSPMGRSVD